MIPDIRFRELKQDDINILAQTFCFPWTTPQETQEKWQHYFTEQQAGDRTVCLVERKNQVIGYGSLVRSSKYPYFRDQNIPEIHDVWIIEAMRNQGCGRALITYLEHMARKENYTQIGIGVGLYRDYGPAQKLYMSMGYIPDGMGVSYQYSPIIAGAQYPVDDDLILWLKKSFC